MYIWSCLQVHMSTSVTYISSAPPELRTRVIQGASFAVPHVDRYAQRPSELQNVTFMDYFEQYEAFPPGKQPSDDKVESLVGQTSDGRNVYKLKKRALVRFTDYHPVHQPEAFFYNVLLRHKPFRQELGRGPNGLLSPDNCNGSWMDECRLQKLVTCAEDLEYYIERCAPACPPACWHTDSMPPSNMPYASVNSRMLPCALHVLRIHILPTVNTRTLCHMPFAICAVPMPRIHTVQAPSLTFAHARACAQRVNPSAVHAATRATV